MKLIVALCLALGLSACTTGDTGDPDPVVDAGADDTDASGDLIPFMSDCSANEQCETGLCYQYNEGPQLCTHSCTSNADCEAPSPGCNGMGVCKRPQ